MVVEEKLTRWLKSVKTPYDTKTIADRFMVSPDHARDVLSRLHSKNMVVRLQKGNRAYWKSLL